MYLKKRYLQCYTGDGRNANDYDQTLGDHHLIVPDGYNKGRDWLVERAVEGGRWKGMWWKADVEWKEGLLKPGSKGGLSSKLQSKQSIDMVNRNKP